MTIILTRLFWLSDGTWTNLPSEVHDARINHAKRYTDMCLKIDEVTVFSTPEVASLILAWNRQIKKGPEGPWIFF